MIAVAAFIFFLLTVGLLLRSSLKRSNKLPPGPFIGSLLRIPSSHSWLYFTELKAKYGNIVYFSAFGQSTVILNTPKAAFDLLVKRASIYSDRPRSVLVGELIGMKKGLPLAPYGDYWRAQRRLFHQHLYKNAVQEYYDCVEDETRSFVLRLHEKHPWDFVEEFRLSAVRLILDVTYGLKVHSLKDEYATLNIEVNKSIVAMLPPGCTYHVEAIPALLHIPSWFPGAGWKRKGEYLAKKAQDMVDIPYEQTKRDMARGIAPPSFTANMLETQTSGIAADEQCQKWLSGMMHSAGTDTIVTAFGRFLWGVLINPGIQSKIQEELDRVVGNDRLPSTADKDKLLYVDAVIKETLRWNILTPMGVPHRVTADDEYEGHFIPKGSTIVVNSWAISQDPEMYPSPGEFLPERFLPTDKNAPIPMDPRQFVFGFGRRVCPGRQFAELVLYNAIVSTMATSNILRPLDEGGKEYLPTPTFGGGILSFNEPFACRIEPRSATSLTLLSDAVIAT